MPKPLPEVFAGTTPLILTPWLLAHLVNCSCSGPGGDTLAIFSTETIAGFHWLEDIKPCPFHCSKITFCKVLPILRVLTNQGRSRILYVASAKPRIRILHGLGNPASSGRDKKVQQDVDATTQSDTFLEGNPLIAPRLCHMVYLL